MPHTIRWTEDYATGIDIIDLQHKRIFEYLQEIDQAIKTNSEPSVELVVRGLLEYAVTHNTFEESLMQKADYPLLEPHHNAHEAFRRRTEGYVKRLELGEDRFRIGREVRNDIGLWLTGHIKREDQHYVPWLRKSSDSDRTLIGRMLQRFLG